MRLLEPPDFRLPQFAITQSECENSHARFWARAEWYLNVTRWGRDLYVSYDWEFGATAQ
jgi:hypothetical protein